jgi:DNA-binding LacI/PurR family transcriptional regulator
MVENFRILLDLELAYVFDRRAFAGITALANENGHIRLVRRMNRSPWEATLRDRPVDGIIVPRLTEAERLELLAIGLPFVCLADVGGEAPNQYVVAMDEAAIGAAAAQYFLDSGFQNFAVFARPNARRYFTRRLGSFAEGASAAGYACVSGPPSTNLPVKHNGYVED